MTTIVKATPEEIETFKEQQTEICEQLRELVADQMKRKAALRKPHISYMGKEMWEGAYVARKITYLHMRLNELYGKPNSHKYKKTED